MIERAREATADSAAPTAISPEQLAREHDWVLAAQRGDQAAFGLLVEAYQRPVYNLAYRMLGHIQEAQDAAQETFLRAYINLPTYDPARKFSNWLLAIASHYCIDRLRRRRHGTLSLDQEPQWRDNVPDPRALPEVTTLGREQEQLVQDLLAQLPENDRLVITLFYWYDLSCQEIGEIMGLSEGAVKVRLHRARKKLVELIQAQETPAPAGQPMRPRFPFSSRKEGQEHALSRC
ncbi:MAG: sigma-70 family RNA polymerase sigma factor [Chloroflexi bacterium]|nr:sigma-70 family RNA polymerase sigma factor [Chloroflexota bacterium]MBU1748606.1 sigma-70 family RNA polymerase sigma factor [Chloroflexota bacterium]